MSAFSILRAVHLLAMGLWFGGALFFAGDIRRTLARGAPHVDLLVERVDKVLRMSIIAGFLTIGTGFGMVFIMGGMKVLPIRMHVGTGLALMALVLEVAVLGPAFAKVTRALADQKLDDARAAAKKLAPLVGIEHALKLAAFVTMIVRV